MSIESLAENPEYQVFWTTMLACLGPPTLLAAMSVALKLACDKLNKVGKFDDSCLSSGPAKENPGSNLIKNLTKIFYIEVN